MRIVHIVHQYHPETFGGLEAYVADLAGAQVLAGHDVRIASGSMAPAAEPTYSDEVVDGIAVRRFQRSDLYFDAWDKGDAPRLGALLEASLREWAPDLVHVHHWIRLSHDLVQRAKRLGLPVVATLHDFASTCPRCFRMRPPDDAICLRPLSVESCLSCVPRRPWQDDAAVTRALQFFRDNSIAEIHSMDRVVVATSMLKNAVRDLVGADTSRFDVVPLAYQPRFESFTIAPPSQDPVRIGYWGSITARKGVVFLVDAFRRLLTEDPALAANVELHLFGRVDTDDIAGAIRDASRTLPVIPHGAYEFSDLAAAGLTVAVFPSLCLETYGYVLDEAFELGLPVVVPDAGALGERAGRGGERFRAGDVAHLAEVLRTLVTDSAHRRRLTECAPPPPMSLDRHHAAIDAVYEHAIRTARSPEEAAAFALPVERRAEESEAARENQFRRLIEHFGEGKP